MMAWAERGIRTFAVAAVLVVLSTIFVALRFVSRGRILKVLGPTDWFMLVNLVGALLQWKHSKTGVLINVGCSSSLLPMPPAREPVSPHTPDSQHDMEAARLTILQSPLMAWATTSPTLIPPTLNHFSRFVPPVAGQTD